MRFTSGLGVDDLRSSSSLTSGSMASSLVVSAVAGPRYNLGLVVTALADEQWEDAAVISAFLAAEHLADVTAAATTTGLNVAPSTDDSSSCAATPARGVGASTPWGRRWVLQEPTPSAPTLAEPCGTRHSSVDNLSGLLWWLATVSSCNHDSTFYSKIIQRCTGEFERTIPPLIFVQSSSHSFFRAQRIGTD